MDDTFDPARVKKLIQQERILKNLYDRSPKKDVATYSIFKALILPDRQMMDKYRKTR